MTIFNLDRASLKLSSLQPHRFKDEGRDEISPQNIIAKFPELILALPELGIPDYENALVAREFSTRRGSIDVVIITGNADIILVETKLLRNSEAHRAVVAQAIDYAKAFNEVNTDDIKSRLLKSDYADSGTVEAVFREDSFCAALDRNVKTGNYKIVIAGDGIHPNILGMVESIQSAPHLAFTVYLAELAPHELNENNIAFHPRVIANTNEIERSVIRVVVDHETKTHKMESEAPDVNSKGSRPTVTRETYLESLPNEELSNVVQQFWRDWGSLGGDVRFGTVGFSTGVNYGGKRIALQFVYDTKLALISDKWRTSCGIPDDVYTAYREYLRLNVASAYDHLVSNKVELSFDSLGKEGVEKILAAAVKMAKELLDA